MNGTPTTAAGVNPALAGLAPDRAPPPPGWWPPAPGWWLLAILAIALVAGAAWWLRQRERDPARRLRRAALREFDRLAQSEIDAPALARGLEHLTRRYALGRFGRDAVAGLSGEAWLAFAIAQGASDWAGDAGRALLRVAYGGALPGDAESSRDRWLSGARTLLQGRQSKAAR